MIVVLLVDDQRFVGAALSRLIAGEQDIELHCCYDAVAAVAEANQVAPTVILQDLVMPGIDGLTLLGMFRSNPTTAHTPVIVLSGNDDADTRTRALAAGANDYLVKLPAKTDLLACIRRHAAGRTTGIEVTLDPGVMAAFLESGTPEFAVTLIDQFIQEAQSCVGTLRDAAQRLDSATLKSTAHSLKGSSSIMGASRLAALCAQLEDHLARRPDAAVAPALMGAIDEEFGHVREAFVAARLSHSGSESRS
jgi:CheY-like chemotaxis protein/HPt (histidine-containing phosphotransfer) domain-containing protein